ncbi:enoyl-CoA hydratase/isomerase family protein [Halovivax sp.]|uniref:enoyl-CoA hydratase/isomerase family protein n=1 Tax=Halovivax sp. TaxID=1935978 RepID=UPI0025C3D318|nr:enoyl-CoA hydratase/isomerase family protein [Halovivax sp.]
MVHTDIHGVGAIEPTETDAVEYRLDDQLAYVTLTRPERLNAVTAELYGGICGALASASADEARAVVLEGEGRAFCVGADMKNHDEADRTAAEKRRYAWAAQHACRRVQLHEQPVVAKVQGYAIGAGAELALSADLVVMAADAEIRFPETSIGTFVGGGVTYTLPQRVGVATAKRLLLTAATVDAETAADLGLVDDVVPADELDEAVVRLATEIAENAPISVAQVKELLNGWPVDPSLAMTAEVEALLTCMESRDWREGVEAFADEREPVFEGR